MYIKTYQRNGKLESTYELNEDNLKKTAGMLSKIILKNGDFKVGYSDPFRLKEQVEKNETIHEYICLWTFKDLDEENHQYDIEKGIDIKKVYISDIESIHSILYSHPRWGGHLTNEFWIDIE